MLPLKNDELLVWSEVKCRLFAYGPADATAIPKPRHLLPYLNPDLFLPHDAMLMQYML